MKNVTKLLLLVCAALTALSAFASCEVIASTAGQDLSAETMWLSLTPTKPDFGDDGTGTAKLTLVFNKAIAGLTGDLDAAALANFFTFECDYPADFPKELKAEKISESAGVDAAVYTLTVGNIPATGGIARVTINKTGITPPSRAWSLNGQIIPDEAGAALLDFRFVVSAKNPSLGAEAIGSIDHVNKKIVVTVPEGTDTGALTPTVTVNAGCTVAPEGVQDFGNPLIYTVTADETGDFRDYEVTVHVQTSSSASIEMFQFLAGDNAPNLTEDVSGIITGSSITVAVPSGTALGALTPSITWVGGNISPESGVATDFSNSQSNPVQWTVTATDGTTQADYWVTVNSWTSAPSIALTPGHSQLGYTITASDPEADSYDVYWVAGSQTNAAAVKGGTKIEAGTSLTGVITGLNADTLDSVIVVAHKAGWTDCDSLIVSDTTFAVYAIGGTGPAGGWIFYENPNYAVDGWRYLEAAPTDLSNDAEWGVVFEDVNCRNNGIGMGKENTRIIVAKYPDGNYVANLCDALEIINNGITYDDWFLPSVDELFEIRTNLIHNGLGDFTSGTNYWSSSEDDYRYAWQVPYSDNRAQWTQKDDTSYSSLRAVRSF